VRDPSLPDHPELSLTLTIRAVGQAAKRGAIPRLPTTERLLSDIDEWLLADTADVVRRHRRGVLTEGGPETIEVQLHPVASSLSISVAEGGLVRATATTTPVGPGYHTYVARLLHRMADAQMIEWAPAEVPPPAKADEPPAEPSSDDTGYFFSGDRRDAERGHLTWLGSSLAAIRDARQKGASGLHFGTPPGVHFTFDGAVATVLGPRDDAWLDRALADPRVASDIWPWVTDALDARYLHARARCLLWLDIRWRAPAGEEESATLDEVLAVLRRGYALDPELDWPWAEWREVAAHRGTIDPATKALLDRAPASSAQTDGVPIGYRRRPVTIVHEGWALEVPGTFAERRSGEEWWGGEAGRSVTLAGTATGTANGPMPAEEFIDRFAAHLGSDALKHESGPLDGRARLSSDPSSGIVVATVEGYSAIRGKGAAIKIVIEDPQDWKWALDTWRALRPA
jgi:hypothetical protein